MRKIAALILFLLTTYSQRIMAQSFGVEIAFATSKALGLQCLYNNQSNNYKFGLSYQFSNARGELVRDQLPNYGQTTDGSGRYFWTIDLGYGKLINEKIIIDGEVSIGAMYNFTNYLDSRFTGGGYHLITKKETALGVGLNLGYMFDQNFGIYTGFNTIRKLQFGIRYVL